MPTPARLAGVGVFVLSGLLLFAVGLFMIGDRQMAFVKKFTIYTEFRKITGLQPGAQRLKKILADYSGEHQHRPQSVLMLVGPEGDFTPAELALARRHGCRPITLGPIVLRVETAAIYCLSVLSYELLT